jgi:hypothetical protein
MKMDEHARTNELLTNLTAVIVAVNSGLPVNMPLTSSLPFSLDPTDARINSCWSLSLILSVCLCSLACQIHDLLVTLQLCIAALAVACRSFLGMLPHSKHMKPVDSCVDLWAKWNAAERLLSPIVDVLPSLLIFPVVLFLAGLLDLLLSNTFQVSPLPKVFLASSGIGLLSIAVILIFLFITLVHACIHPGTSPFSSSISIFFHKWLVMTFKNCFYHISPQIPESTTSTHPHNNENTRPGHQDVCITYHEIIPTISDDDTLDAASTALNQIILNQLPTSSHSVHDAVALLNSEQCKTILHILSPEASLQSNLTAAGMIIQLNEMLQRKFYVPLRGMISMF